MTAVERRTVTTVRHEYYVSSPATVVDVQLAITMALRDMPEERQRFDDACMVEARDGEVVIWWPEVAGEEVASDA